jgi:hypothetical protein
VEVGLAFGFFDETFLWMLLGYMVVAHKETFFEIVTVL